MKTSISSSDDATATSTVPGYGLLMGSVEACGGNSIRNVYFKNTSPGNALSHRAVVRPGFASSLLCSDCQGFAFNPG